MSNYSHSKSNLKRQRIKIQMPLSKFTSGQVSKLYYKGTPMILDTHIA
jgi:hypothetical protein